MVFKSELFVTPFIMPLSFIFTLIRAEMVFKSELLVINEA